MSFIQGPKFTFLLIFLSQIIHPTGDTRVNEHLGLMAIHTLFVREHNRLVTELRDNNPETMTNSDLYDQARKIVGAQLQAITYNEFLPLLLGSSAIPAYTVYNKTVNPSVGNEFSAASYRFGHSLLSSDLLTINDKGQPTPVPLRDAFFDVTKFQDIGLDAIFRGFAAQQCQEVDTKVVDDVRNFLFADAPGMVGLDLVTLNIQRGRDHGLSDYNTVRRSFGLPPVTAYHEITSDTTLQRDLGRVYGE